MDTDRGPGPLAADRFENNVLPEKTGGGTEEVRIAFYERKVPQFVGAEIDRLYGHIFCSLSYFELKKQLPQASTYLASCDGNVIAVLLYIRTKNEVTVINEYATLPEEEIRRFVRFMFDAFDTVKLVSFRKIRAEPRSLGYPWHATVCSEDMVIDLPCTVQEYETAVGKNMRRNIKRYGNALAKDFPSFQYRLLLEDEIEERQIRDIIALSCKRLKGKNVVPRYTEEEIAWIISFARKCGMVGLMTIDGRICAGAIGFRIGDHYTMHVIAHDQRYNDYSLGILCYYRTICEGIARGGKRFHLQHGQYSYKRRLLAQRHDIISLDVYRSRLHALAYGVRIIYKELQGRLRRARQWLLYEVEQRDGWVYRQINRMVKVMYAIKRAGGEKQAEHEV